MGPEVKHGAKRHFKRRVNRQSSEMSPRMKTCRPFPPFYERMAGIPNKWKPKSATRKRSPIVNIPCQSLARHYRGLTRHYQMDLASFFDYTLSEAAALIHYLILTIYDIAIPKTAIVVSEELSL